MSTKTFLMKIEYVFKISGTGEVITGVLDAPVSSGDTIMINGISYEVGKIVVQKTIQTSASAGTDVGINLVNATHDAIGIGDFAYLIEKK